MSLFACSTLVPWRRITIGFFMPMFLAALITPDAITSHRMIPPKMFTKIVATYSARGGEGVRDGYAQMSVEGVHTLVFRLNGA